MLPPLLIKMLTPLAMEYVTKYIMSNIGNDARDKAKLDYGNKLLSDETMKWLAKQDRPLRPEEIAFIAQQAGKDSSGHSIDDTADWDEKTFDGYAEHIKNYLYTYKPEAVKIDPRIDPDERHIGVMAQDIEKVNPACIKETDDGVKTVDTGRLALMNAGAIGEAARKTKDLEERIAKLEEIFNGR